MSQPNQSSSSSTSNTAPSQLHSTYTPSVQRTMPQPNQSSAPPSGSTLVADLSQASTSTSIPTPHPLPPLPNTPQVHTTMKDVYAAMHTRPSHSFALCLQIIATTTAQPFEKALAHLFLARSDFDPFGHAKKAFELYEGLAGIEADPGRRAQLLTLRATAEERRRVFSEARRARVEECEEE